jgi:hypothetical protein
MAKPLPQILFRVIFLIVCSFKISFQITFWSKNKGLTTNVSYANAVDSNGNQIFYSLNSKYFSIDEKYGSVYLISHLSPSDSETQRFENVTITATNGVRRLSVENKISIVNANKDPPRYVGSQTYLEIVDVGR